MTYKLKNKFKYKPKTKNYKYKTKTGGIQQIVNVNFTNSTKRKKRKQQPRKQILNNVRPSQMSLNQSYTQQPITFNDTIFNHKLGLLELQALETKNNIISMNNKAQSVGAIEGETYINAIEKLTRQYETIEEDYNDTKQKAGMMFGKIGETLEDLRERTEQREFKTPYSTEKTLRPPEEIDEKDEPPSESSGGGKIEDEPKEKPEDEPPKEKPEDEPEEKHKIYYSENSMYSNLTKLIGTEATATLRKYLEDQDMDRKKFVKQMYSDKPEIGYTEDTTERKKMVKDYVETVTGTKKRANKK